MYSNQDRRDALLGRRLTARELQILRLTANGRSNAEIGRELWITAETVKSTQRRIQAKLGAVDRAHAVGLGFARELLNATDLGKAA
jgi:DNA-binding CsgD family transcriptional regulator